MLAVIPIIIEQHAEEAAFNWLLRDRAVGEPNYDLADLAHLDGRVEANLDGLRIAGDEGWKICQEAMAIGEPGEIFTAGALAFAGLVPERMDALLAAVEEDRGRQRALASVFGWIDFETIAAAARRLLNADLDFLKYIGLAAHAVNRRDPGALLAPLMEAPDGRVRARALKAAGELGRLDLMPVLKDHLRDEDEKCRFHAAWSAMLLGGTSAIESLTALALAPGQFAQRACHLVVRKMASGQAVQWLQQLGQHAESAPMAVSGCGALGDPALVPWLLELMRIPESARKAGEALAMITGVDIAYEDLEGEPPEGFESGPSENPEDEDVALDPDEDLPWPEPELIKAWWAKNGKNFKSGTRYLCGKPISPEHCREVLKNGYQRQRAAAALELVLMAPGQPLFEVRAPGFRQQRQLANA
ncbi:MAG: TIGR02270 family protein [Desulfobacterales bacterium]|nr:TIGR02270 family protein [Desulfobacterales bacterium]